MELKFIFTFTQHITILGNKTLGIMSDIELFLILPICVTVSKNIYILTILIDVYFIFLNHKLIIYCKIKIEFKMLLLIIIYVYLTFI
jgi:hypothetical protein